MPTPPVLTTVPPVPQLVRAHEQVAEHYRTEIRKRRLRAGADFPSVRDISVEWGGISTNTALRATRILRDEGWIEMVPGKNAKVIGVPKPPAP